MLTGFSSFDVYLILRQHCFHLHARLTSLRLNYCKKIFVVSISSNGVKFHCSSEKEEIKSWVIFEHLSSFYRGSHLSSFGCGRSSRHWSFLGYKYRLPVQMTTSLVGDATKFLLYPLKRVGIFSPLIDHKKNTKWEECQLSSHVSLIPVLHWTESYII